MTSTNDPGRGRRQDMDAGPGISRRYDALDDEFALASALIRARGDADMTQEQVAAAMGTTQAAIARLESGRIKPTTRTLEQYAKATHTRLRISFEAERPKPDRYGNRNARHWARRGLSCEDESARAQVR